MTLTFSTLSAAVESADRKLLTWSEEEGDMLAFWNGAALGRFTHVGSGFLMGEASYRGKHWTTDNYSYHGGLPIHLAEEKLILWCQLVDSLAATERAA